MSVLESLSNLESPSPSSTELHPRARIRTVRPERSLHMRMRAVEPDDELDAMDEGHDADADEGKDEGDASPPPKRRRTSSDEHSDGARRYEFRERRSTRRPERHFDDGLYADLFTDYPEYTASKPAPDPDRPGLTKRRHRKSKARRERSRRAAKTKRSRRAEEEEEESEEEGDEVLDFASDSDIEVINQRIAESERLEKEKKKRERDSGDAKRATRYSLRSRESLDLEDGGQEEEEGGGENAQEEEEEEENAREEDEDENEDEEEDDSVEETTVGGYNLRHRQESTESDTQRTYGETQRTFAVNQRPQRSARALRAQQRASRTAGEDQSSVENDNENEIDTGRRYALRDRAKVQRMNLGDARTDPSPSAFAEYAKRRSNGLASHRTSRPLESNRNNRNRAHPTHRSRRKRRHRRSRSRSGSSSPSSSSSESDSFKYYDSDGGGMRTSGGRGRGARPHDRKRADITPIEVDRSVTWASVGGLDGHVAALKEMVMLPLLYPEFYDKYHISPPSGVLFYGPPGTGKTLLARALANSCSVPDETTEAEISSDGTRIAERKPRNVTFYMRKGADCLSKWVGEAERQLRLLFEEAKRNQPSIIFFDEIDGLAPVRSAKQDQIHASIVSTLLALMDGMDSRGRVVVIGATNRLDAIDPALRRPGRFDRELGFKLPNVTDRTRMLRIHTTKWDPVLSDVFVHEIAEKTVGYCGADIKALCAEAALCSLRRVYPQIYGSQDKLLIQLERVVVSRSDFASAMKKITPASHRTVSSFAAPLPHTLSTLLEEPLHGLILSVKKRFPLFPLDHFAIDGMEKQNGNGSAFNDDDEEEDEDEDIYMWKHREDCDVCHGHEGELRKCSLCPAAAHKDCLPQEAERNNSTEWTCSECCNEHDAEDRVLKQLQIKKARQAHQFFSLPQHAGFPRVLVTGVAGMGQQYIGAAMLHVLEGLTHFSLDYPALIADTNSLHPEEALIRRLNEAQKCLPCVLYLPQVDLWWENTTESMHVSLKMMLMNMQIKANLPIMFLASTSKSVFDELPTSLQDLFANEKSVEHTSIVWRIQHSSGSQRRTHFAQAFEAFAAPPLKHRKRKQETLEVLPLAPVEKKTREPTLAELQHVRQRDMHCLRELRIFLGQVLDYCGSQKMYAPFLYPVDPGAVPDYYVIIENPMDLSTMREKLNDGDYTSFEQFVDDLQLIVKNANMFNPKRSATRHIAHAAGTMKDNVLSYAHRFRKRQGYDLFAKCREITKRLHLNPGFYSGFDDIPSMGGRRNGHARQLRPEAAPKRSSARLKGIAAPEVPLAVLKPKRAKSHEKKNALENGSSEDAENHDDDVGMEDDGEQEQWFNGDGDAIKTGSNEKNGQEDPEEGKSKCIANGVEYAIRQDELDDQLFEEGAEVVVAPRTFPGVNKLGGAGFITRRRDDNTYDVKYVLGGYERNLQARYIKTLSDETIQQAVIHHGNQVNGTSNHQKSSAEKKDASPIPTKNELERDFFTKLVWPILEEEGWTCTVVTDVSEEGETQTKVQTFYPPVGEDEPSIALEGSAAALRHIKKDPELLDKCFGRRYSEKLLSQEVFDESQSEIHEDGTPDAASKEEADGDASTESAPIVIEAKPTPEIVVLDASMTSEETHDDDAQEAETPDVEPTFIYDESRMDAVLNTLVDKTAGWTTEELRDGLIALNKLAYPYRFDFDRTELMETVERHVDALSQ